MKRKLVYVCGLIVLVGMLVGGVAFAAFVGKARILGSSFSVGSADIKLLDVIGGGVGKENLLDEKQGPIFANISPDWSTDYLVQIYNNSSADVAIASNANYETVNDPENLRQLISVELFEWNDDNDNGTVDDGELGDSLGEKTIVKWKTEGFSLGVLSSGQVMSLVLRFSAESISDSKQGASAVFDFEFDSIGL